MPTPGLVIEGLDDLRRDLRRAEAGSTREVSKALRKVGQIPRARGIQLAPRRAGGRIAAIASAARIQVRGSSAALVYRGIAGTVVEFQRAGRRGATLTARYGAPPRFAFKALAQTAPQIVEAINRELAEILSVHGWFRG